MANNLNILDSSRVVKTVKTTEAAGVHTGHVNVDDLVPGVAAADLGKAEDAVHASGDTGVMALGVRKDAAVALAGTDGDYIPPIYDASGRLHVAAGVAGENHLGEVGQAKVTVSVTPTVDTAIYALGDLMGGKLTFANAARAAARGGEIITAVLSDLAAQNAQIDLVLFDEDPTGTTFTDQAALDIADADLPKIAGVIPIATADYHAFNDSSAASVRNVGLAFKLASGTSLFGALVCRGTPTYVSASDVQVHLAIEQD